MILVTDSEIRAAIISTISTNTGDGIPTGDAVLLDRWVLGVGIGESVPYFTAPSGKLHAYMVSLDSMERQPKNATASQFIDTYTYRLWAFYGYRVGSQSSNSDRELGLELQKVQRAISRAHRLGIEGGGIRRHHEWQISKIDIHPFGKVSAHVAQGTIAVETLDQL